jgi:hypothetical protein
MAFEDEIEDIEGGTGTYIPYRALLKSGQVDIEQLERLVEKQVIFPYAVGFSFLSKMEFTQGIKIDIHYTRPPEWNKYAAMAHYGSSAVMEQQQKDADHFSAMAHYGIDSSKRPPEWNKFHFKKSELEDFGIIQTDDKIQEPINDAVIDIFRDAVKFWVVVLSIRKEKPDIDIGTMKNKLIAATTGVSETRFDRSFLNIKDLMKYATSKAGRGREQFIMAILSLYCQKYSIPLSGDKRKLYNRLTCHDKSRACQ